MKRILLTFAAVAFLGCGRAAIAPPSVAQPDEAVHDEPIEIVLPDGESHTLGRLTREPGDFVVFRFSGKYRDKPVTLRQRVLRREGTTLIVDVELSDEDETQHLRLSVHEPSGELLDVTRFELDVAHVDGERELPFGVVAFEELMGKTMLLVDDNEAVLGSTGVMVELPGAEVSCTKTSYRVRVGLDMATMHTLTSDDFAWGDVGGEVVTDDGTVLYRAEVLELNHPLERDIAIQSDEEFYDDFEDFEE